MGTGGVETVESYTHMFGKPESGTKLEDGDAAAALEVLNNNDRS